MSTNTDLFVNCMISFKNLKLINPLIRAISEAGCSKPCEIQCVAIPKILEGRDILAFVGNNEGKTEAFVFPILQLLKKNTPEHTKIRTLILTSSIESAKNIEDCIDIYSKYLPLLKLTITEEFSAESQLAALRNRTDLLIATPERLLDVSQRRNIDLSKIEILVLDDADAMCNSGIIDNLKKILKLLPQKKQTLVFYETVSDKLQRFLSEILSNPVEIITRKKTYTPKSIQQSVYFVEKRDKTELLIDLLQNNNTQRSLVFLHSKYTANELVRRLKNVGVFAETFHGSTSQAARQNALEDFKNDKIKALITTDIAAKAFDIDELLHVVNYELPDVPETYLRRIERIGSSGSAVSFCTADERTDLINIQNLIGFTMPVSLFSKINL